MNRVLLVSLCLFMIAGCAAPQKATPTEFPPTITPSAAPSDEPGLVVKGHVRLTDGSGQAGVHIYQALATYSGDVVAITGHDGYFESGFKYIPGDEMVRVWAELEGYTFEPENAALADSSGAYYWRHYHGHSERTLDFVAKPAP